MKTCDLSVQNLAPISTLIGQDIVPVAVKGTKSKCFHFE